MNLPKMNPVDSTNLESVGYDGTNLFVRFKNGSIYVYIHVPESLYQELLVAESKGKFLSKHVKGAFLYERIA